MQNNNGVRLSARDRILETAGRLFYRDGFRSIGIDTIVAESGVAKMTLYRHFSSKDELIAAYLERSNQQFWAWIEGTIAKVDGPRAQIIALFAAVGKIATSPECMGCTFQGAAAEFLSQDHLAHKAALAHKQAVQARLRSLAEQAGLRDPQPLANQLLMLMDGAWMASRMYGPQNPAVDLAQGVTALINAHS